MANNYVIYSDETFRNLIIPDWVAELNGWPTTEIVEINGEEVEQYKQWSLYEGYKTHGTSAGKPFPIREDLDGYAYRSSEEEATDWAAPYNSVGGDFHGWIKGLADLKQVDYEACYLSVTQTHAYIVKEEA